MCPWLRCKSLLNVFEWIGDLYAWKHKGSCCYIIISDIFPCLFVKKFFPRLFNYRHLFIMGGISWLTLTLDTKIYSQHLSWKMIPPTLERKRFLNGFQSENLLENLTLNADGKTSINISRSESVVEHILRVFVKIYTHILHFTMEILFLNL